MTLVIFNCSCSLQKCEIKTCKDVKENCRYCKSGIYDLEILGQKTKAFCDLTTDGGKICCFESF